MSDGLFQEMPEMREVEQVTERLSDKNPCKTCQKSCSLDYECEERANYEYDCIKKLEEYEAAEEDGRMVVLPCKIGTTVFQISYGFIFIEAINRWINTYDIVEKPFKLWMVDEYGKSIFLTRKKAKKALKEMKNNERLFRNLE